MAEASELPKMMLGYDFVEDDQLWDELDEEFDGSEKLLKLWQNAFEQIFGGSIPEIFDDGQVSDRIVYK